MKLVAFVLNIPWTVILLCVGVFSIPYKVSYRTKPVAIIVHVRSFWYYRWVPSQKGVRAMSLGNAILLGPKLLENDLAHELVHVKQHGREPFVHPFLNLLETFRRGYRRNKYEVEAYSTTQSIYVGRKLK